MHQKNVTTGRQQGKKFSPAPYILPHDFFIKLKNQIVGERSAKISQTRQK